MPAREASRRASVLVTVGMGPWPFDRLIAAISKLTDRYDVFAQIGTSTVDPGCRHEPFVPYAELRERIASADIVITHAGNTVRLVQRAGGVPIVVAREHDRGEMGNDHQVAYLRQEEQDGRVIAVWDVDSLDDAVAKHEVESQRLLAERQLGSGPDMRQVADLLDQTCARLVADKKASTHRPTPGWDQSAPPDPVPTPPGANPFARHPIRRYDFAWRHTVGLEGPHLDLGAGYGDFAGPFAASSRRPVSTADVSAAYVAETGARFPALDARLMTPEGRTPFPDASFTSVSMLDVLEHTADESRALAEAHRLLVENGTLVVSVPRRHLFTWLDPDNVKYRWPRLHKMVYQRRFGAEAYQERFVDVSDGFYGDIAVGRGEHTNYRTEDLLTLLRRSGFKPEHLAGANLFWRWFQIPYLLGGKRIKAASAAAIRIDGTLFDSPRCSANLFVVARRTS